MSTNGDNLTEDAEMAECDGDKVVTMMDVLQEQQEFEEDANAVLGASDDKNCTYSKGNIKRQAIYACLSCCTEAKEDPTKRAGVCLACSLTCHENHDLVELYTKRNFRCDCGNPKFNSHPCHFTPIKTDLNEDNSYNQNFSGLYCVCHRPYPDPEATMEDDMIQCIICEDWLHSSHLEATVPSNEVYAEMICKGCMEQNEFLHDYTSLAVNCETDDVDIVTINGNNSVCNGDLNKLTVSEVATVKNEELTKSIIQMDGDQVDKSAAPSDDVEAKSVDDSSEAADDKVNNIEMTDEVEKNMQQSEYKDIKETVKNIDSSVKDEITDEVLSTETSIEQTENETSKTENAADVPNTCFDDQKQHTEITVEKMLTEDDKPDDEKEGELPIGEKTQESNANNENTNINVTNPMDDTNSNVGNENPENKEESEELVTKEECSKEIITALQNIEEITTSNDQDKAENIINDSESTTESTDQHHLDKAEPTINTEKTEDQKLLDDLNELTSDKEDLDKTNIQQDINIEDKVEVSNAPTTKESEQTNDDTDELKDQTVSENDNSEIKEPIENDTNTPEIAQSTEIAETSQNVPTEKENNITDSVMSAIDEILEGSSEVKSGNAQENDIITKEPITDTSIVTNKLDDKDMKDDVNKVSDVPDKTESDDKKVPEDIEMADQNEAKHIENDTTESENKDIGNETSVDDRKPTETTKEELGETGIENSITKDSEMIETKQSEGVTNNIDNSVEDIPSSKETDKMADANIDGSIDNDKVSILTENTNENKRKHDTESEDMTVKKAKLGEGKSCIRPRNVKRVHNGATFWPSNFRQKLCTCGECILMYKDLNVLFLTDLEDTVTAYECLGKENVGISQYEKGLEALSSLDRIQQINALTEYNKMRDKLLDFLKSFKDRKEIVKEEDIKAFFAGMKPKREPDGVYFCR